MTVSSSVVGDTEVAGQWSLSKQLHLLQRSSDTAFTFTIEIQ
jgi:hypothetical protein